MKYTLLTNNPAVRELIENETQYRLFFVDGSVQAVISKCEALFLQGSYKLDWRIPFAFTSMKNGWFGKFRCSVCLLCSLRE